MSLILGYANKNNAIIMSDGRAGENGSYAEHYNKTLKINDNIIIGFAGYVETIEHFLKATFHEMGEERDQYYINDFWELMQFAMNLEETQKHFHSTFIIIGRDNNGNMHTSIMGQSTDYKLETSTVATPRVVSIGGTIDGKIIEEIYMRNIKKYNVPIDERMRTTIQEVSQLDISVNTNCFSVKI